MSNSNDPKSILDKYRAKVAAQSGETAHNEAEKSETAHNGQSNEGAQNGQQNATAQNETEKNGQTSEVAQGTLPNQAISTRSGAAAKAEPNKKGAPKQSALKNASALEKQKQQAVDMFDQLSQRSDDVNAKYFQKLAEIGNMPDYDPNSKKTKKALDKVIAEFAPQFAELENGFRDLDALLTSIDNAQWVDG